MPPQPILPVIAVTGLAFEARIAAGHGVVTVCGNRPDLLEAAIAQGCQGIISFGIAGGLVSHMRPGSCIVARAVVAHGDRFSSHPEWSDRLLKAIRGSIHADIAGATAPIATPADKRAIAGLTGAVAVDMESYLSVRAAIAHGLPFAAVRVVADPSHRGLPPAALGTVRADGTADLSAVLRSIVARPGQIGALIRAALDTRTARTSLVRARRLLGPGLSVADLMTPAEQI
jgi:hopanoid-associated phosphorylase